MASLTDDDLDGVNEGRKYPDGTVIRVFCMRTDRDVYSSGWAYKLHYGATEPDPPRTLDDGTIRRYDNSHEDTKGHELHIAPFRARVYQVPWDGRTLESVLERDSQVRIRGHISYPTTVIPMNDTTPPLHPMEREQLRAESTLVVTVKSSAEFHDDVSGRVEALDRGDTVDSPPTLSFTSYDELLQTLTPRTLDLIEVIRRDEPASINETARIVDRDVKNVHEELSRLAQLGILFFEEEGNRKRPVVWFDELLINLPFDSDTGDAAATAP